MKVLTEQAIISIIKDEYNKHLSKIDEDLKLELDLIAKKATNLKDKIVISPGLEVKTKKNKVKYTVASINPEKVVVRSSTGKKYVLDKNKFEKDFELS